MSKHRYSLDGVDHAGVRVGIGCLAKNPADAARQFRRHFPGGTPKVYARALNAYEWGKTRPVPRGRRRSR